MHKLFPVAIGAAEGEALREWVKREGAIRTVEVGFGYGLSTLFISEGLLANGHADVRHVVMDPHQSSTRLAGCGLQLIDEAGLRDLIEFYPEESQVVLPRLLAEGRRFDLAFVDGDHRFDGVFLDLVYLGRLVRGGGVLFVDDYQLPSIKRATAFCTNNLGWTIEETSFANDGHHWVVLRTPAAPGARTWDHFVDF